jgi:hypothetical protein
MIRQYFAQRCRGGDNPLRVGVIPVGAIFYIQDDSWWRARYRGKPVCRNPWFFEGFLNGAMGAARRNRETGLWETAYRSGRSDMAVVRSLRDDRRRQLAVRVLVLHDDEGLIQGMLAYPTLLDLRHYRRGHATTEETDAGRADRVGWRKRPEPRQQD